MRVERLLPFLGLATAVSIPQNNVRASSPSTNPGPSGWTLLGCYTDSVGARTLGSSQAVGAGSSGMTVAQCAAACQSAGYSLAGVEYSSECYCDVQVRNSATIASSGCDMTCSGNSSEYCGGSNRITVYQTTNALSIGSVPKGWTALGCYTDNTAGRTLGSQQQVAGGSSNMTISGCIGVCSSFGYSFAGLEYAQECYCSNDLENGGSCASDQSTCYMPCTGGGGTCGGGNRLSLYYSGSNASVVPCSAATIPSTHSSSLTAPASSTVLPSSSLSSSSSASTSSVQTSASTSTSVSSQPQTSSSSIIASSSTISSSATVASPSLTTSSTSTSTSPTSTVCPTYWAAVASDLAVIMRDASGQCTDTARAAIRYAFHDAATFSNSLPFYAPAAGGADGSLLLSATEINRTDNAGLNPYHDFLTGKFQSYEAAGYSLTAADLIQFAGALGVMACPGGRIGRVYVGRTDTTVEAPTGLLPDAFGTGSDHDTILALFVDKGFSATDLAALIGAHTSSKARFLAQNGIPVGTPQDTTPGLWDVSYYNETLYPPSGIGRFESDINLSQDPSSAVGKQFRNFIGAQASWGASFSSAYQKLSTLGLPRSVRTSLVDCTNVVSSTFPSQ